MDDPADIRFFEALKAVCDRSENVDDTCRATIRRALDSGDPNDLRAARVALDGLDTSLKDSLLRQVHLLMATDLSAICDTLPGAPGRQRPN